MATKKLKIADRVKRANVPGCRGTIKEIRQEVIQTASSLEDRDRNLMVYVQWDNGTLSSHATESLELVKE